MLVRALIRGESPVGFWHDPALTYRGPPPEYFQCLALSEPPMPRGEVSYAPAFG